MKKPIPAVWRIDVEPDDQQPEAKQKPWEGFVAMKKLVDGLRDPLAERSGHVVQPTWMVRLDPEIERCFGQLDYVVNRYNKLFDQLIAQKDLLGIHVHPVRFDQERLVSFSDHADDSWTRHCLTVASDTFAHCFGEPVRRSSQGGYFLSETLLDDAIALGIQVDLTVESGLAPKFENPSFGTYATAPSGDFRGCPRQPYYPSRDSFSIPSSSSADGRPILIVPLSALDYETPRPRRIVKKLLGWPRYYIPLNPWKEWPNPRLYWDLVEEAADEGSARYFAFAIRTDSSESITYQRVRTLLEYLPNHPISARLQFVDPLGSEIRALVPRNLRRTTSPAKI